MSLNERLQRLRMEERDSPEPRRPEAVDSLPADNGSDELDQYYQLKHRFFETVMREVPAGLITNRDDEGIDREVGRALSAYADQHGITLFENEKIRLVRDFRYEFLGFGPLQPLLEDLMVTRIAVAGPQQVEIDRGGQTEQAQVRFRDEDHLLAVCQRMAAALSAKLDRTTPLIERRLRDGSHVRLAIPPLARRGASIRIQKQERNPFELYREEEMSREQALHQPFNRLRRHVIEKFISENESGVLPSGDGALQRQIETVMEDVLEEEGAALSRMERERLLREVIDEVTGLGPIQSLVDDPTITEIMVNGPHRVYIERRGRLELTEVRFHDDAHVLQIIEKIVAPLGRRIDEASPMVDARLQDGSRVNAIIHPLALKGPSLTIRKFSVDPFTTRDLIQFGTLTPQVVQFLEASVFARLNIIVSGGTGAGKTTLLNVLSSFIPPGERIITIEDAAELQLRQEHIITLEARPPNIEGKGQITIRDLVRNALRMRPDRIVVGECRSGEALDMLQAMNTGHDGSITTIHANNPRELLSRLETMVLMAGVDLPVRAIREQIAGGIDLIVHVSRFRDGSRRVNFVTEVAGMEGDVITLQDIFLFEQRGISADGEILGSLEPTGILPRCFDRIKQSGSSLSSDIFSENLTEVRRTGTDR